METLTVRIEGESSGLERELDRVVGRVEELGSRLSSVGSQAGGLERVRDGLNQAVGPAERLGRQLDQVATKLAGVGRIPVTINANAALATLASLNAGIDATTAKLRSLSGGQGMLPGGVGGGGGPGGVRSGIASGAAEIPRLAGGGSVRGSSGWDRVPAWLTAGEYVVSRPAVDAVGLEFLEALNRVPQGAGIPLAGATESSQRRGESARPDVVFPGVIVEGAARGLVGRSDEPPRHQDTRERQRQEAGRREGLEARGMSVAAVPEAGERPGGGGVVNHFGGLTIQVKETVEMGRVVGELRRRGVGGRLRRGS